MEIKVADKDGNIFTNNMNNNNVILEMHFCTSYTQCIVQYEEVDEEGKIKYLEKNIIIPVNNKNDLTSTIDFMAVNEDEIGRYVS